jgi:hypothetical protein
VYVRRTLIIILVIAALIPLVACDVVWTIEDAVLGEDDSAYEDQGGEEAPSPVPLEPTSGAEVPAAVSPASPVSDKWELWTGETRLRGVVLHPCTLYDEDGCVVTTTHQDVQDVRHLGAHLINASYPGPFSVEPPYEVDPVALEYLDNIVSWAEQTGIYVVIHS